MKILLLGEYSNVHATLEKGLKELGHEVLLVSNGDFWKGFQCDISLIRTYGMLGGVKYMARLMSLLPRLRGFDVVQIINPMFLELKAERIFPIYKYLRRHNKSVVMGAFGMDYYWVNECITRMPLRYSDFNIGTEIRHDAPAEREYKDWLGTEKERLNKYIANDCDRIVTGLYEYDVCYRPNFPDKTEFIPYPIEAPSLLPQGGVKGTMEPLNPSIPKSLNPQPSTLNPSSPLGGTEGGLRFFIGISKNRSAYKGTDVMWRALIKLQNTYPDRIEIIKAEGVPFNKYWRMMEKADVVLDQLYSYTPAMNGLLAMSKGKILVGGGEEENYEILGEKQLRPIINVLPNEEDVYNKLRNLVVNPDKINDLKAQSKEYISRHHDYIKVAKRYETLYKSILCSR